MGELPPATLTVEREIYTNLVQRKGSERDRSLSGLRFAGRASPTLADFPPHRRDEDVASSVNIDHVALAGLSIAQDFA
jgi:hypothetical protein